MRHRVRVAIVGYLTLLAVCRREACRPHDRPTLSWPVALRQVQGWLDPWTMLWRYWRAWSSAPPPPALQALLDAVANGRPLHLPLRV